MKEKQLQLSDFVCQVLLTQLSLVKVQWVKSLRTLCFVSVPPSSEQTFLYVTAGLALLGLTECSEGEGSALHELRYTHYSGN